MMLTQRIWMAERQAVRNLKIINIIYEQIRVKIQTTSLN